MFSVVLALCFLLRVVRRSRHFASNYKIFKPFNALQNACSTNFFTDFAFWINLVFWYRPLRTFESLFSSPNLLHKYIELRKNLKLYGSTIQQFISSFKFKFVKNIILC